MGQVVPPVTSITLPDRLGMSFSGSNIAPFRVTKQLRISFIFVGRVRKIEDLGRKLMGWLMKDYGGENNHSI